MKVGLFSPYLSTLGGGERYLLTIAKFFLDRGDDVTFYTDAKVSHADIFRRFNLDLNKVAFLPDIFFNKNGFLNKVRETAKFDWFIFMSDGSIPFSLAKNNILHFQVPLRINGRSLSNKLKLSRFNEIICNSNFTKYFIDKSFNINSKVVYPPVSTDDFLPGKKEKLILSVGRFFFTKDQRVLSDPKKFTVIVDNFVSLCKKYHRTDWKLVLVGGSRPETSQLISLLEKKIGNYPVKFVIDPSFSQIKELFAAASIYWHAAGFGEDLETHPDRAEHFGITTVEAMAAGAVPVVFNGGGQAEIVSDGQDGYLWNTQKECLEKTSRLTNDPGLRDRLSTASRKSSQKYSVKKFFANMNVIINE